MTAPAREHVKSQEIVKGRVQDVEQCAHCLTAWPCQYLQDQQTIKELRAEVASLRRSSQSALDEAIKEGTVA